MVAIGYAALSEINSSFLRAISELSKRKKRAVLREFSARTKRE